MNDWLRDITNRETFCHTGLQQSHSALIWMGRIIEEEQVGSFLEIGTGHGGTTVLLGLYCPDHGASCDTVDLRSRIAIERFRRLEIAFVEGDCFDPEVQEKLHRLWDRQRQFEQPALFFCDGGNKEAEFAAFAPWLRPHDLMMVHDTGYEFFPDRPAALQIAQSCGLQRLHAAELLADGTRLTIYRKGA